MGSRRIVIATVAAAAIVAGVTESDAAVEPAGRGSDTSVAPVLVPAVTAATAPTSPVEFERARTDLAAQLASHPEWPQRQISTDGHMLFTPYSPHDPRTYLDWLTSVGRTYGAVQRVYTPGPGEPTQEQLVAIRDELWREIHALDVHMESLVIGVDLDTGSVNARYMPARPEVVALFEQAKKKYGDLFTYSETSDPGTYP